jgi:hypothetical protein
MRTNNLIPGASLRLFIKSLLYILREFGVLAGVAGDMR